jgi:hypothetical protein
MRAQGRGSFQRAVARAYNSPFGLGGGVYHLGDDTDPASGSQSAADAASDTESGAKKPAADIDTEADSAYLGVFRREVLEEVGGFDETLLRAEDWELNSRIRAAGYKVVFTPRLQVGYWPRDNWSALRKQMYATGVWRGALVRRQGSTPLRYLPPPAVTVMVGACLGFGVLQRLGLGRCLLGRIVGGLLRLGALGYFVGAAVVAATKLEGDTPEDKVLNWVVLVTMHLSWGAGFIKGFVLDAEVGRDVDRSRHASPPRPMGSTRLGPQTRDADRSQQASPPGSTRRSGRAEADAEDADRSQRG